MVRKLIISYSPVALIIMLMMLTYGCVGKSQDINNTLSGKESKPATQNTPSNADTAAASSTPASPAKSAFSPEEAFELYALTKRDIVALEEKMVAVRQTSWDAGVAKNYADADKSAAYKAFVKDCNEVVASEDTALAAFAKLRTLQQGYLAQLAKLNKVDERAEQATRDFTATAKALSDARTESSRAHQDVYKAVEACTPEEQVREAMRRVELDYVRKASTQHPDNAELVAAAKAFETALGQQASLDNEWKNYAGARESHLKLEALRKSDAFENRVSDFLANDPYDFTTDEYASLKKLGEEFSAAIAARDALQTLVESSDKTSTTIFESLDTVIRLSK